MKRLIVATLVVTSLFSTGCGTVLTVSKKRFGRAPMDVRIFVTPDEVAEYDTAESAWRTLENGYVYISDKWYLSNENFEVIPGGNDFWLLPTETQYLIDTYPNSHGLDCEDGAAWLASAFIKQGIDAWFCVGTVNIDGVTYGHAWTMVKDKSGWVLYETTVDKIVDGLPSIYTLCWRTNGKTTWVDYGVTGVELSITQIPPDKLSILIGELDGE